MLVSLTRGGINYVLEQSGTYSACNYLRNVKNFNHTVRVIDTKIKFCNLKVHQISDLGLKHKFQSTIIFS